MKLSSLFSFICLLNFIQSLHRSLEGFCGFAAIAVSANARLGELLQNLDFATSYCTACRATFHCIGSADAAHSHIWAAKVQKKSHILYFSPFFLCFLRLSSFCAAPNATTKSRQMPQRNRAKRHNENAPTATIRVNNS